VCKSRGQKSKKSVDLEVSLVIDLGVGLEVNLQNYLLTKNY
jgi:hypothetical protein